MLFSGKENIFMCLVAFQKMFRKIFSGAWLCSWKYHRKHIFYLLLTFSRLPNKYIISFIPQYKNKNKIQKKNIIKSGQIERKRKRERRLGSTRGEIARRGSVIAIGTKARSRSVRCCSDQTRFKREREIEKKRDRRCELDGTISPLRLWVVLSLSLSPFARLWAPLFARLSSGSDLKVK